MMVRQRGRDWIDKRWQANDGGMGSWFDAKEVHKVNSWASKERARDGRADGVKMASEQCRSTDQAGQSIQLGFKVPRSGLGLIWV